MTAFHRTSAWISLARRVRAETRLPATCVGCHGIILDGEPFDIGHILDATLYPELALTRSNVGPQHRGENRRAGGRRGAAKTNAYKRRKTEGEFPKW